MLRQPRFAGQFYSADRMELTRQIADFLGKADVSGFRGRVRGIIVPHAGYSYSGQTAAYGYKCLRCNLDLSKKHRFFLLGPSHRMPIPEGRVLTQSYTTWRTPLGDVRVEPVPTGGVFELGDWAHSMEHSLEVQLPFLQSIFSDFSVVPLLVSLPSPIVYESIHAQVGEEDVLIASTDLSHYLPQKEAEIVDRESSSIITSLDLAKIYKVDSCGQAAVGCLVSLAIKERLRVRALHYTTSGPITGDFERVVGYGSFVLEEYQS